MFQSERHIPPKPGKTENHPLPATSREDSHLPPFVISSQEHIKETGQQTIESQRAISFLLHRSTVFLHGEQTNRQMTSLPLFLQPRQTAPEIFCKGPPFLSGRSLEGPRKRKIKEWPPLCQGKDPLPRYEPFRRFRAPSVATPASNQRPIPAESPANGAPAETWPQMGRSGF